MANGVVDAVNAITVFNSEMERLGITYDSLKKISTELVDLSEYLNDIQNWRAGVSISSDDIEETVTPIEEHEPVVVEKPLDPIFRVDDLEPALPKAPKSSPTPKKEKQSRPRLTDARIEEVAEYLRDKYDNKKLAQISGSFLNIKKYNDVSADTLKRLVTKKSYVSISNKYFTFGDDERIHAVKPIIKNKFNKTEDSLNEIAHLLKSHDYDPIRTITNDMSSDDVVKVAVVRWSLFKTGECEELGGGVKEIFIMEAITKNKRANNQQIQQIIENKYHLSVDGQLISAVRTGRAYKDIYAKFGQ